MQSDRIKVRWGSSLNFTVTTDEPEAESLRFLVGVLGDGTVIDLTFPFVDRVANVSLTSDDTSVTVGEYDYQFNIVFPDGEVEKYPDADSCDDCGLPTFEVCPSLDQPEVS